MQTIMQTNDTSEVSLSRFNADRMTNCGLNGVQTKQLQTVSAPPKEKGACFQPAYSAATVIYERKVFNELAAGIRWLKELYGFI